MSQPIRPQDRRDTRIFLFALLLAVMTLSSATQSAAAQTTPYFEETECMFETLFPGQIDAKTRCGYVTVPELRQSAASTDATIRLRCLGTL